MVTSEAWWKNMVILWYLVIYLYGDSMLIKSKYFQPNLRLWVISHNHKDDLQGWGCLMVNHWSPNGTGWEWFHTWPRIRDFFAFAMGTWSHQQSCFSNPWFLLFLLIFRPKFWLKLWKRWGNCFWLIYWFTSNLGWWNQRLPIPTSLHKVSRTILIWPYRKCMKRLMGMGLPSLGLNQRENGPRSSHWVSAVKPHIYDLGWSKQKEYPVCPLYP